MNCLVVRRPWTDAVSRGGTVAGSAIASRAEMPGIDVGRRVTASCTLDTVRAFCGVDESETLEYRDPSDPAPRSGARTHSLPAHGSVSRQSPPQLRTRLAAS